MVRNHMDERLRVHHLAWLVLLGATACAPATALDEGEEHGLGAEEEADPVRMPWWPAREGTRPWRDPLGGGSSDGGTSDGGTSDGGTSDGGTSDGGTSDGEVVATPTPYGYWGLNGYVSDDGLADVHARLGAAVFQVANENPTWTVGTLLPMVQEAGMTVTLRMTGGPSYYTDSRGNFDLELWKDRLDAWVGSGVQDYIDDGTLVGHMLLDDIHNFTGSDPTGDELDEMARYSKELLPGLMTYVRCQASTMPTPTGGTYLHVDASVNQYQAVDGAIEDYYAEELAAAEELDLGIINGLNIADGGDGSSGQPGWRSGRWAMSADEIVEYGELLADMPGLGMFLNWEYDGEEAWSDGTIGADYFDQPEIQAALVELGTYVSGIERTELRKE